MTILSIADLPVASRLDSDALANIRGGFGPAIPTVPVVDPKTMFGAHSQLLVQPNFVFGGTQAQSQGQSVVTSNGNNAAFVAGGAGENGQPYTSVNNVKF